MLMRRSRTTGMSIVIIFSIALASLWPSGGAEKSTDLTWRCTKRQLRVNGGYGKFLYQRLADHTDGVNPNDLFFDRLVYIHHEGQYDLIEGKPKPPQVEDLSVTLTGVIISETLVLTSWNPFRNIIRFRFKRYFTSVCITWRRRYFDYYGNIPRYQIQEYEIDCARPVIPFRDTDIPIDLWHGYLNDPKMHSPIHDLVVFRVNEPFDSLSKVQLIHNTNHWQYNPPEWGIVGPVQSFLANENDVLGRTLKFAMLGHSLEKEITLRRNIYSREYEAEENVVTDCDEWIPREWGWFICLRNLDDIPRLASGAMLFHNDLLYGVGSFALWKGNQSILVFTDVRKYNELIFNTCTEQDQLVPHPKKKKTDNVTS